ncbi:MAG: phage tail tape measure protein, partial [Gammaproteobacteria bacterium]|nr:phage tail tape measure protein [Gammaproteobacteria bacterium]
MASKVKTQLVIEGKNTAQPAFDQGTRQLNNFTSQAKTAAGVLAGVFSVGALSAWIKESALATAQMSKLAMLSGASAEEFQGWAYAAKSVGIEQDKLGDIFKDVQDKVGDFLQTGGGTLADFFENIAPKVGVTAEQFRNLSGPDALGLYVSSLEKANLSQSEMTFYMESIANDATLLLPLLQGNAAGYLALRKEAEALGLVLGGDQVRDAEEFRQSLQTLGAVSEGAGRQISAELLPTLNEMTGLMAEVSRETELTSTVAQVLSFGLKALASIAIIVGVSFANAGRLIGGAAAAALSAATGEFSQAR